MNGIISISAHRIFFLNMKPLSEEAPQFLVIQIQIHAVCHPSMLNATLKIVLTSLCIATILGLEIAQSHTVYMDIMGKT